MKNIIIISAKIFALFITFQLIIGCMTLPGRMLPTINKLPDKTSFVNKPKVFIDVSFHTFLKGLHLFPTENVKAKNILINKVKEITEESKLFETYTMNKYDSRGYNYILQIDMLNYGDYNKAYFAGVINGFTLGLIPVATKDHYKLTAKLFDAEGNEIKTYIYEDYIKTWFHLFLFPFINKINTVPEEVWENMLKNLYNDILNDNLLKYSQLQYEPQIFITQHKNLKTSFKQN